MLVPCKRPPANAKWLARPFSQIALDPLPTKNDRESEERGQDARNNCDVTPCDDLLGVRFRRT